MTFASRAKALKDKSKITLAEIAAACNISESMASRYINGQNIPPEDIARKMLEVLNAAVPTDRSEQEINSALRALRSAYEERIDDMRVNIADMKEHLKAEKKEKWSFFILLAMIIIFIFALTCIDITNGNIGWFRN